MCILLLPLRNEDLVLFDVCSPLALDLADALLSLRSHLLLCVVSLVPQALNNGCDLTVALLDGLLPEFFLVILHLILLFA